MDFPPQRRDQGDLLPAAENSTVIENILIILFDRIKYSLIKDKSSAIRQLPFSLKHFHAQPGLFIQDTRALDLELHEQPLQKILAKIPQENIIQ